MRGRSNFGAYCMVCHGLDGQNTGVPFADKMSPPVPPLNSAESANLHRRATAFDYPEWDFSFGHAGLEGDFFTMRRFGRLVLYIRHLPPKGSLGEPQVYGGEPAARISIDQR